MWDLIIRVRYGLQKAENRLSFIMQLVTGGIDQQHDKDGEVAIRLIKGQPSRRKVPIWLLLGQGRDQHSFTRPRGRGDQCKAMLAYCVDDALLKLCVRDGAGIALWGCSFV